VLSLHSEARGVGEPAPLFCETIKRDCPFPEDKRPKCTFGDCPLMRVWIRLGLDVNPSGSHLLREDKDRPIIAMPTMVNPAKK